MLSAGRLLGANYEGFYLVPNGERYLVFYGYLAAKEYEDRHKSN